MADTLGILGRKQRGRWQTVDRDLIDWAWKKQDERKVFGDAYSQITLRLVDFVPCEAGCGTTMLIGEQALVVTNSLHPKKKRVFCSMGCQRRSFIEMMAAHRSIELGAEAL